MIEGIIIACAICVCIVALLGWGGGPPTGEDPTYSAGL